MDFIVLALGIGLLAIGCVADGEASDACILFAIGAFFFCSGYRMRCFLESRKEEEV